VTQELSRLGVLAGRPDADRVTATLLEFDARNVHRARHFASSVLPWRQVAATDDVSLTRQIDKGTKGNGPGSSP
jgi:hypothetical protein